MALRDRWLFAAALLLLATRAGAQEKPNTLTPREIADGWVLLFDGETTFGWKAEKDGVWSVANGALRSKGGPDAKLMTTSEWGDFELKLEVAAEAKGASVAIGSLSRALPASQTWQSVTLRRETSRIVQGKDAKSGGPGNGESGDAAGRGAVRLWGGDAPGTVRFRNVKLRPLGLKSVFNGRDLTGWKEVPGRKSVYSVTPEGWLNVKNGNGDLQTEAQWGDFVLQLDILSNGEHLNSGVFFRANPGGFWSGYEAQIRNQWQGDDRSKPVDFGTGGLYNRQPARRVVSNDREWFTMTVLAHGTHLATWVNGYQVTDFTDTRPPDEGNARSGARTRPGVISLQGHDPTTDLSFRNIRVGELPAAGP